MRWRLLPLLLAVLVTNASAREAYEDPRLDPVFRPVPENIELLRLENGLEVVLMRNPAQPMVGIYTQVKVGSAREDYRTSGMSHMLEHLLFNGSEKYTQEELYDAADLAGAYNNANTTDFYTNYMMVLPAAGLETGIDLQSQMLFHSLIPTEKFEKEKGIVLGEIVQSRDRPGHYATTMTRQALYEGSSLSLPTLGTRSTIEHMQRDDVAAFYRTWYVPNNMVVTVAGNFDRDRAVELLESYYGSPAPGTLPSDRFIPAAPIDRTRSLTRRGGDDRRLLLSFAAPEYGMDDYFPFLVLTELLQLDGSGILTRALDRLDAEVRPEVGLWWEKAPGFGRLNIEFDLKDTTDPTAIYTLIQDGLRMALDEGMSAEDILGITRTREVETLLEREQLRMTGIFTAETLTLGGVDFFVHELARLGEVRPEEVARAADRWLRDAPCLALLIEPELADAEESEPEPAGMTMPEGMKMPPAMAEALARMEAESKAETPEEAPEEAVVVAPAPLRVDRSVLESGAVLVSQTNPASPLMAVHLAVRGRALIDAELAAPGALDIVHRLLDEGLPGCDDACVARRLRELGAVVKFVDNPAYPMDDYYTTPAFSFIRMETAAGYGPELLELVLEMIREAEFDEEDFERVRAERVEALGRLKVSARREASRLVDDNLYGGHPAALPPEGSIESLSALTFDQIRTVYRSAFAPENLLLSVVGPVAHDDLKKILDTRWDGDGTPGPGLPPIPVTEAAMNARGTVGGEMGAVRMASVLDVEPAHAPALELLVAVLSDRIAMDLRETRGLSYSVGATVSVHSDRARFLAWINPPVERLEEGRAALAEFLTTFDAATVTQEELDKIRAARSGRRMMRRLSSLGQAYYLALAELDDDIAGYLGALTAYDGVTPADLAVAGAYLKGMNLVEVVVD